MTYAPIDNITRFNEIYKVDRSRIYHAETYLLSFIVHRTKSESYGQRLIRQSHLPGC